MREFQVRFYRCEVDGVVVGAQSIWSQAHLLSRGEGHLSELDDASQDSVFRVMTGLGEIQCLRKMGMFLCCFRELGLD